MRNSEKLVSIVIPAYNSVSWLADSIDSALAQSYRNIEIIVVNDASDDSTEEYLKGRCADLKYVCHSKRRGLAEARNSGISASSGDFLQFLDADDKIESDKILRQIEFFDSNPNLDIVYGDVRYFKDSILNELYADFHCSVDSSVESWLHRLAIAPGEVSKKLVACCIMPVNCALVKRRVFENTIKFDSNLCFLEDWDFWWRAARAGHKFGYCRGDNGLSLVRVRKGSMSSDRNGMTLAEIALRIKFLGRLGDLSDEYFNLGKVWYAREHCNLRCGPIMKIRDLISLIGVRMKILAKF